MTGPLGGRERLRRRPRPTHLGTGKRRVDRAQGDDLGAARPRRRRTRAPLEPMPGVSASTPVSRLPRWGRVLFALEARPPYLRLAVRGTLGLMVPLVLGQALAWPSLQYPERAGPRRRARSTGMGAFPRAGAARPRQSPRRTRRAIATRGDPGPGERGTRDLGPAEGARRALRPAARPGRRARGVAAQRAAHGYRAHCRSRLIASGALPRMIIGESACGDRAWSALEGGRRCHARGSGIRPL
jgi:hypothetical protein